MVFGGAGFLLGVFFVFALRDTSAGAAGPGQEMGGSRAPSFFSGLAYFAKKPSAWCAMAGFVAIVFVNNAYLFWAPRSSWR